MHFLVNIIRLCVGLIEVFSRIDKFYVCFKESVMFSVAGFDRHFKERSAHEAGSRYTHMLKM